MDLFKYLQHLPDLFSYGRISGFIRNSARSELVRNVAIVATGTAAAQLIRVAFSPLITRIYNPEVFGFLGAFMSIANILIPVAAFCYPIAIVLPRTDGDALGLARLSAYTALVTSLLAAVVLLSAGEYLAELFNLHAIRKFLILVPLIMFSSALMQIAEHLLIRKKQFNITARATAFNALIVKSAQAGIGWFYPFASVLIALAAVANAIQAAILGIGIKRSQAFKSPGKSAPLRILARRYYDFPLYRMPQMFVNAVSESLPVLLLSGFFTPAAAGFYTLAKTVMGIPAMLISRSVASVFYPHISEHVQNGVPPFRLIIKATATLGLVGFLPFSILGAFGPGVFEFVFGSEWVVSGDYARWLALWLFFGFINAPSVASIPVLSMQGFFLFFELVNIAMRSAAIAVGFYFFESSLIAVALFCLTGVFMNMILITVTLTRSKKPAGFSGK